MKNKKLIELIKEDLSKFKEEGNEVVEIERLTKYLTLLQDEMSDTDGLDVEREAEIERIRSHYSSHLAHYEWQRESSMEMFKSVIASGQNSLKSCMLIHAGACVALLAFIGNLVSSPETRALIPPFADVILWFLGGVLAVSISYGATYLTQLFYSDEKKKLGIFFHVASVVLAIATYILFIIGSFKAYLAMKGMI
jgi:hypothetical protein